MRRQPDTTFVAAGAANGQQSVIIIRTGVARHSPPPAR
jgi:hypothetical protein